MKLLSAIVFLPLIGSAILFVLPDRRHILHKTTIIIVSLLTLMLSLVLLTGFDYTAGGVISGEKMQYADRINWIPAFNIDYYIGIDGLNLPFVLLTAFVFFIIGILHARSERSLKGYWALFFVLESCLLGTYVSLDLFSFFMFWTASLMPLYFLLGFWGNGEGREKAAMKFLIYNLTGSISLLAGVVVIYYLSNSRSFDFFAVISAGGFTIETQKWIFLLFALAIATRMPVFPLHGWYVDLVMKAPLGVNIVIASLLSKSAVYTLFRFCDTLLPNAAEEFSYATSVFGVATMIYFSLALLSQRNYRSAVTYSSLSFTGFTIMGAVVFTEESIAGSMMHLFIHGIIICMLFVLMGYIEESGAGSMEPNGGPLRERMPRFQFFIWLTVFAAIGVPGFGTLISQFLIIMGVFSQYPAIAGIALLGILLIAGSLLAVFRKMTANENSPDKGTAARDLSNHELLALIPCCLIIVGFGLMPSAFLSIVEHSVQALISMLR